MFGQVNDFFTKINVSKFCTKYVKIGDLLFFWRFKVIFPKCETSSIQWCVFENQQNPIYSAVGLRCDTSEYVILKWG